LIRKIENANKDRQVDLKEVVEAYIEALDMGELDEIYTTYFTHCDRWLEMPRSLEVLAILHRMRFISY
jgi:nitrate reductase assembly molybdenum cofactor insertion protein NarJ